MEIKPVPASGGDWQERHKSIHAFLNTGGGILILGIKEEATGPKRRYIFQGWKEHAEPNLKEIPTLFTDRKGTVQNLADCFPPMPLLPFMDGKVAVVSVDEPAADRRFVFLKGNAHKRILSCYTPACFRWRCAALIILRQGVTPAKAQDLGFSADPVVIGESSPACGARNI